ncbi:RraA family protein [Pseudoroseomonas globiformis]|uniref:Putative 4-hydroxy-4-methyl-2-oxoglutarate aldolase n=1 Tax=Teichococcus globiformis TaxID=2307229 RepID=A0ABV7G2G4_9PROT
MTPGFRILRRRHQVAAELVERFRTIPVANISDSMSRMMAGGPRLRPLHAGGGMAGPALTVKLRPGDNLMLHKALDMAEPGDIIVADAGGDLTTAIMGDLMLNHAIRRGIGGIIINGAVRDVDSIRALSLPLYAAGVTHRGPYKDGPGEINVPVALDGMVVEPGDLVLGDADGVLAVPRLDAEAVLAAAEAKQAAELREMAAIREGTSDRSWVDKALQARGCIIEE